jgi:hypothetical protein
MCLLLLLLLLVLLLLLLLSLHAHAADGNVYLYDLAARQRLIRPVTQLQVASSSSSQAQDRRGSARGSNGAVQGVNALAYNAVVPSTLAAAAGDQVKVGLVKFKFQHWYVL